MVTQFSDVVMKSNLKNMQFSKPNVIYFNCDRKIKDSREDGTAAQQLNRMWEGRKVKSVHLPTNSGNFGRPGDIIGKFLIAYLLQ